MSVEKDFKRLAAASQVKLRDAQDVLVRALNTNDMKMTKEQIKLFTCPWWKFWNGWF